MAYEFKKLTDKSSFESMTDVQKRETFESTDGEQATMDDLRKLGKPFRILTKELEDL